MPKFISDRDMMELEKPSYPLSAPTHKKFLSDDEMKEHEKQSREPLPSNPSNKSQSWMDLAKKSSEDPLGSVAGNFSEPLHSPEAVGALIGSIVGTGAGPISSKIGRVGGAAIGGYLGKATENVYNRFANPEEAPKNNHEYITDPIESGANSALLQGTGDAIASKIPAVGQYIKNKLKDGAERLSFRALGPFKRQVNQNKDRIHEIGRTALDENVIKFPPGSAETVEGRAKEALHKAAVELDKIVDDILTIEKQTKGKFSTGNVKRLGDYLRSKLIKKSNLPEQQKLNAYFEDKINELVGNNKTLNFDQIRAMKLDANQLINWDRLKGADIPLEEQYLRTLSTALKESEEYAASKLEKVYYGESSNKFPLAKNKYGNLKEAQEISGNRADAQRANQILGLKSSLYGAAGATLGGNLGHKIGGGDGPGGTIGATIGALVGGGTGAIGNHLAKNYGSQFSAVVLDKAAKLIAKSPGLLNTSQKYPNFIPFLLRSLESKNSEKVIEK